LRGQRSQQWLPQPVGIREDAVIAAAENVSGITSKHAISAAEVDFSSENKCAFSVRLSHRCRNRAGNAVPRKRSIAMPKITPNPFVRSARQAEKRSLILHFGEIGNVVALSRA